LHSKERGVPHFEDKKNDMSGGEGEKGLDRDLASTWGTPSRRGDLRSRVKKRQSRKGGGHRLRVKDKQHQGTIIAGSLI